MTVKAEGSGNALQWSAVLLGWFAQTMVSYFAPMVLYMILSLWVKPREANLSLFLDYGTMFVFSASLSLAVSRFVPTAPDSGRWVWLLPVGILSFILLSDLRDLGVAVAVRDIVGRGEDGWIPVLVAMPVWGCCWYSLLMQLRRTSSAISGPQVSSFVTARFAQDHLAASPPSNRLWRLD